MGDPPGKEHSGTCMLQVCGLKFVAAKEIPCMVQRHYYHHYTPEYIY